VSLEGAQMIREMVLVYVPAHVTPHKDLYPPSHCSSSSSSSLSQHRRMAETLIPASRVALVDKTIRSFVDGFLKPVDHVQHHIKQDGSIPRAEFLKPYHADIHWYDHAFLICRVGHEAVIGLQTAFRHCNDPFDCEIKVSICLLHD
jgi:hypothetical protein